MSVSKLLSRIVAPDVPENADDDDMESALHDYTYGITSDPLTHFAVILSALIHDGKMLCLLSRHHICRLSLLFSISIQLTTAGFQTSYSARKIPI